MRLRVAMRTVLSWKGLLAFLYGLTLVFGTLYYSPHMFSNFGMYYFDALHKSDRLENIVDYAVIAITLGVPVIVAAKLLYSRKRSAATKAAAITVGFFYSLLGIMLISIKVHSCELPGGAIDQSWQCSAQGGDFAFCAVLVALLAGLVWVWTASVAALTRRLKR